jgi:hypothetical protein
VALNWDRGDVPATRAVSHTRESEADGAEAQRTSAATAAECRAPSAARGRGGVGYVGELHGGGGERLSFEQNTG